MENKKLATLLVCSFAGLTLLAGCNKQEDLNQNWDRPDFGWARDGRTITGSGWRMQWPRDWMWPRNGSWSGQNFSGTQQNEMMWNPNWTEKVQEASLPATAKLSVSNACIWCGKCARIASSNFEMQWWRSVVKVKSQENINSQSVSRAIQGCPVDAISLKA